MKILKSIAGIVMGVLCLSTELASGTIITLDITADIDGHDRLFVTGNSLTWQHFEWQAVGLHSPTIISETIDGITTMDQVAWTPTWPNGAGFDSFSSTYTGLVTEIPQQDMNLSISVEQVRDSLMVMQAPAANNEYTTIIDFNDNPPPGDTLYQVKATFDTSLLPGPEYPNGDVSYGSSNGGSGGMGMAPEPSAFWALLSLCIPAFGRRLTNRRN